MIIDFFCRPVSGPVLVFLVSCYCYSSALFSAEMAGMMQFIFPVNNPSL